MGEGGPARSFRDVPTYESATCAEDLAWMLDRLRAVDIRQAVAVDLTDPDLGIPVVRVVIPGLESSDDHDRYLPGARVRRLRGREP
jgi:ribosomal protein S12 methylthiotransferase accessory factor